MAETTTDETKLTRAEAATFLRTVADQLDSESRTVEIPVGNKEIRLSPPETIDQETTITERSRRLRKDTEEVAITFNWNPTSDTAESDAETESDDEVESEPEPETETEPETDH
ncbi:amphi-Trp domain-containing protein [Natronomonas salina]|uniref:amphi-Trp domain-containing protein n=1 Tax=Natronomonas salina TaxID=1710540 RepID=UPI0015B5C211|nr:amphi-Trp domain-containing protein [Natronomonas salina]QLD89049.1 amphi-Trp domain-containing protein [Natronomonas salina]